MIRCPGAHGARGSGRPPAPACEIYKHTKKKIEGQEAAEAVVQVGKGTLCSEVNLQGSGLRAQGSGLRVQGSGFRAQGSGFRAQGSGFRVQGSGFRVQGSGFRV
jgi:hypothetical protein